MEIWLTSSGIDADMGGIASVTRSCLAALNGPGPGPGSESTCRVTRFLQLRRPNPERPPRGLAEALAGVSRRSGRGSRARLCLEVARQVVARPDLVLYEHVDLAQCQSLIPRRLRRPYAVWGHGIELWRPLPERKVRALKEADLLLFNSAFTREKAASHHPWILDCPARVLPLCRERDSASESESESESDSGSERRPWILTVGRLLADRPKGHAELLAALPELAREVPELHWHVLGDGPWREAFAAEVAASPERARVTLHGFVDGPALDRLYRECRVYAMPSRGEGFGLVYAEAMARGLPCVGSTLDAAPEVIGEGGRCVDPDDAAALREALLAYLRADPEAQARHAAAARLRADFFEPERFARDLRGLMKDRGGAPAARRASGLER